MCTSIVIALMIFIQVKEFDEPQTLLRDRSSEFFSLAAEAGLA